MAIPENVQESLTRLGLYNYNDGDAYSFRAEAYGYVTLWPQALNDTAIVANFMVDAAATVTNLAGEIEALGAMQAQLQVLAGIDDELVVLAGLSAQLTALADIASAIQTAATNAGAIATVAGAIAAVQGVNGAIAAINGVYGALSAINAVNGQLSAVQALAPRATDIGTLAPRATDIQTLAGATSNMTALAPRAADMQTLAPQATAIGVIATDIVKVTAVHGALSDISLLAPRAADMALIADLQDGTIANGAIVTVAQNATAIVNVAGAAAAVVSVAASLPDVQTVAQNQSAVATVAASNSAIGTVAANIVAVDAAADNIDAIIAAPAAAVTAASQAAALSGTSTSAVTVGTGSKSFTVAAGKQWTAGDWLLIKDVADPTIRWLHGQITSYVGTSLTVNVGAVNGSGSNSDWDIRISGPQGAPAAGTGDFVSPSASETGNLVSFGSTTGKLGEDSGIPKTDVFRVSVDNADALTEGTTNKFFTGAERTKLTGIATGADVTSATNVGAAVHGATAKTTPADNDTFAAINSAASNVLTRVTWANIKAALKSYFDAIYAAASHSHAWSAITGKPTTLSGYGIADAAPSSHVGVGGTAHAEVVAGGAAGFISGADKAKLDGVAAGATANATDAQLRDRSTHTGTQAAGTITGLATVATSGAYSDLSGTPTLGSAAAMDEATAAQIRARTGDVLTAPDQIGAAKDAVTLAYSATRSLVWTDGWYRTCTLSSNMAISNPTGIEVGDTIMLRLMGNNSSERTVSWGTYYKGNLPTETVTSARALLVTLTATSTTEIATSYVVIE